MWYVDSNFKYIAVIFFYSIDEWLIVEWDTGSRWPYRFGTTGTPSDKYDVELCCDPRVMVKELIATGCLVTRGIFPHTLFSKDSFRIF